MSRRLARQMTLQTLFQMEFSQVKAEDAFVVVLEEQQEKVTKNGISYAEILIQGVLENKAGLDELIAAYTKDWDITRLNRIDLAILRTAVYEMNFAKQVISPSIAINEAVEIAKLYGDDESPRFINGILGKIVKEGSEKNVSGN